MDAEKLCDALHPYAVAGCKTTCGGGVRGVRSRASGSDLDTARNRAWVKENGHEVSDRGRIHRSIKDAYYAAHGADSAPGRDNGRWMGFPSHGGSFTVACGVDATSPTEVVMSPEIARRAVLLRAGRSTAGP